MSDRLGFRLAFAAMVLALTAACTPAEDADMASSVPPIEPEIETAAPETAPSIVPTDAAASAPPEPSLAAAAPASAAVTPEDLASGASAYARTCAMCHGARGEGTPAGSVIATRDADLVSEKINKGMLKEGDRMPAMAAMMSTEEAIHVARFIAAGFPAQ